MWRAASTTARRMISQRRFAGSSDPCVLLDSFVILFSYPCVFQFLDADLCMFDVSVLFDEWMMVRGC
ncbi:hypothetical protein DAI22_12g087000 [Oryza sativa Japonica Group]|nr:hypothetical protein DAI22_12g087000 [Oryza sativa Japonica Group]